MKDIGSIFPVYKETFKHVSEEKNDFLDDRILFSLCREALFVIAAHHKDLNKKVLIPAYTCQTVITPFVENGWTCEYYNIHKNLSIDTDDLEKHCLSFNPSIIVVHPYYGMDLTDSEIHTLRKLHDVGVLIVLDKTQNIFSTQVIDFIDYTVGSYRKWFPIPDGAYLETHTKLNCELFKGYEENESFCMYQTDAMYLRGCYFNTGDERLKAISIRLNKKATADVGYKLVPHKMADISLSIIREENFSQNKSKRLSNFEYLFKNIDESNNIEFVIKNISLICSAPLYFPLYVRNRDLLQRELAYNHIYAPILWPIAMESVLINDRIEEIYNHILVIPIDQRYDLEDMDRVVNVINRWNI